MGVESYACPDRMGTYNGRLVKSTTSQGAIIFSNAPNTYGLAVDVGNCSNKIQFIAKTDRRNVTKTKTSFHRKLIMSLEIN